MNKCHFIGRLTRDPETRYTASQTQLTSYTLAVERRFKKDEADFINFVAYGAQAEFAEKYLKKGIKIAVTARCQTGSYTNKEGRRVFTTDFIIEEQEFAESKRTEPTEDFMQIQDTEQTELPFN